MWHTFIVRYPQFIAALWQHIQLTVIAIIIASLVAIPLAIWCERHRRYAEYFLQITGIFQTLPSLAILGLLIPLVGIGKPTALIALIIYSLLPIFQNTYLGLASVSQGVLDAGRALGLSQSKILKKIQIPLAMPSIVAGIRTATVLFIGTATLASLIGAGGLGDFILLGIDRNNTDLIVIGAIASAVLAILGGLLINLLSRLRGWLKNSILLFLTLFFIGASVLPYIRTDNTSQTITIAGKLGSEPEILINMYADLIKQDQPKTKIVLKPSFGVTSFLYKALESEVLNDDRHFSPVYQGAGLMKSTFVKANPKVVKAINKLANKISNTDMQKMNYDVNVNHQNPAKVAKEYLDKQGLTK